MTLSYSYLLAQCSALSILPPVSIGIYKFKNSSKALKPFIWYLVVSVFFELGFLVTSLSKLNNSPLGHLHTLIEGLFFISIYSQIIQSGIYRKIIFLMIPVLLASVIYCAFPLSELYKFNSISKTAVSILLSFAGMLYFYDYLQNEQMGRLEQNPFFWINSGVLLYNLGNVFVFMIYQLSTIEIDNFSWNIHSALNISSNVLFFMGLLCYKASPK
jgi:hypothetical protein